jgi:hypothetical protein
LPSKNFFQGFGKWRTSAGILSSVSIDRLITSSLIVKMSHFLYRKSCHYPGRDSWCE